MPSPSTPKNALRDLSAFRALCVLTALGIGAPGPAAAQSLAERVAAVRDGDITFHFTARPGVCGDGEHFIRAGHSSYMGSLSGGYPMEPCVFGPVQVRLSVADGGVTRVQSWVGPLRARAAQDFGAVPAPEAARYLMAIVARAAPSASARAILPAVLADSATVWPALLAVAKDGEHRSTGTRKDAMFWLSRFAGGAISGHPNDPFEDDDTDDPDEELKVHAVFVLSQLPREEGIPSLLEVARTNRSARVRGRALFWLGQSGDSRALRLFESILGS